MNKYQFFSLICFAGFIVSLILGFSSGNIKGGIFIVFPFIAGTGVYIFFVVIFLFLAFLFFVLGFITSFTSDEVFYPEENSFDKKKSVKIGGVVFVGPIPIIFGSNWKIVVLMIFLAIVFLIISFFVLRFY